MAKKRTLTFEEELALPAAASALAKAAGTPHWDALTADGPGADVEARRNFMEALEVFLEPGHYYHIKFTVSRRRRSGHKPGNGSKGG